MGSVISSGFGYIESRQVKKAKEADAEQLRNAGIARYAAGTQDAYDQRKRGEKVASDAIATMAASGGAVESDVVARVKSTTDYNVLSALHAAKEERKQLNLAARYKEYEGKMAKRHATARFLTTVISEGAKMFAMGGAPTSTTSGGTSVGMTGGASYGSDYAGYA